MKKICLLLIIVLLFITGCSKTIKTIDVKYTINDKTVTRSYYEPFQITTREIEFVTDFEIEDIYYDKEFTIKYNNELIDQDTTIYIKIVNTIEMPFPDVTYELYEQIKKDYVRTKRGSFFNGICEEDVRINKFVGVFNNSVVASYYDSYQDDSSNLECDNYIMIVPYKITIEDIDIWFANSNPIRVYNNGQFYSLINAYENNILSYENIQEIANILYEDIDESQINKVVLLNNIFQKEHISRITYYTEGSISFCTFFHTEKDALSDFYDTFLHNKKVKITDEYKLFEYMKIIISFDYIDQATIIISESGQFCVLYGDLYLINEDESIINTEQLKEFISERALK